MVGFRTVRFRGGVWDQIVVLRLYGVGLGGMRVSGLWILRIEIRLNP